MADDATAQNEPARFLQPQLLLVLQGLDRRHGLEVFVQRRWADAGFSGHGFDTELIVENGA